APTPAATPSPTPLPFAKLRVFVAAEGPYHGGTGAVWVLEAPAGGEFAVVARIPQGGWPHNVSVSPDGKWVAVANRSSDQVSVIDPVALREVARVRVGRQPHGILWHPDSSLIYAANERDTGISRIEAGSWRALAPLAVGVPQHALAIRAERANELYFTVTNSREVDHLRVYDLAAGRITRIKVNDVHDVFYTPDGSELWSSSSGFLERPSDRVVIYDPESKRVKEELRFEGRYPFHTMTVNRDGMYFLADRSLMVLSSHTGPSGPSLMWLDWRARRIVGDTPLGRHVFHTTYDPVGDRVLATSNVDGMVNVIDVRTRQVVQKVAVPKPHGIVAVGIR
ncbi:MAG: beta-propeller fold lactonase family protein, partial [Candidatus Limnocylindria bacterium]